MVPVIINKLQEDIIKAACKHFDVSEELLINGTEHNYVYMRWCVFYLVKKHTTLSEKFIANRLKRMRQAFRNGVETIEIRKKIYVQTVYDLKEITKNAGISE